MRFQKGLYWVATTILCSVFLYSAQLYFLKTDLIKGFFESFNYPTYIVIPIAILKVLGVIIILWRKNTWLTEWAYAGFFFDLILATFAHLDADHGIGLSVYTLPFLFISYFLGKEVRPQ